MAETAVPAPLTTTLAMTPEQYTRLQKEATALELARAFTISPADTLEEQGVIAVEANNELRSVKARITTVTQLREGFIAPALQIVENAKTLFNPALDALKQSEDFLKKELIGYQGRVDEAAAAARRKSEEDARIAREKAAREAAAARAKGDEEARQRERDAAAAEAARKKAEEEGNDKAAKKAAAEAAKAQADADAARAAGEAKAAQAELSAGAMQESDPAIDSPKLAGFSTRRTWGAELADGVSEEQAVEKLVCAIAGVKKVEDLARGDLISLLALDMKKANALAKALESKMNAPGLKAVSKVGGASRKG